MKTDAWPAGGSSASVSLLIIIISSSIPTKNLKISLMLLNHGRSKVDRIRFELKNFFENEKKRLRIRIFGPNKDQNNVSK